MQFFKAALSLALLAGSALAQSTQLTYPPPGTTLTVGSEFTVQVYMGVRTHIVAKRISCSPVRSGIPGKH